MPSKAKTIPVEPSEEMLRRLIMQYDSNGDHVLSKDELKSAFRDFGSRFPGFRARLAMKFADKNKSGCVEGQELDVLVSYIMQLGYSIK
ncbi:hypothetical protein QQ045_029499 [Rhodiola kirilowii]